MPVEWREDDTYRVDLTAEWSPAAVYTGDDADEGLGSQLFHQQWPDDGPDRSLSVVITSVSAHPATASTLADGR